MKRMLQSWSLSFFPEVEILASYFAKPLLYGCHLTQIRRFFTSLTEASEGRAFQFGGTQ